MMTPLARLLLAQQRQTTVYRRLLTTRYAAPVTSTSSSVRAPSAAYAIRFRSGESITYSGGQATEGQGGYYGSGGARVGADTNPGTEDRRAVLAMASDVQKITTVMDELDRLESLLRREEETQKTKSSSPEQIRLKASIKKLMTAPDVVEALNRLEIQGEPVWGLSTDEREMVVLAREKFNEC